MFSDYYSIHALNEQTQFRNQYNSLYFTMVIMALNSGSDTLICLTFTKTAVRKQLDLSKKKKVFLLHFPIWYIARTHFCQRNWRRKTPQ